MRKKSDLPFGSEFSPSQIELAYVLELADSTAETGMRSRPPCVPPISRTTNPPSIGTSPSAYPLKRRKASFCTAGKGTLSWKDTYQGMALEHEDWNDLDMTVADGLD